MSIGINIEAQDDVCVQADHHVVIDYDTCMRGMINCIDRYEVISFIVDFADRQTAAIRRAPCADLEVYTFPTASGSSSLRCLVKVYNVGVKGQIPAQKLFLFARSRLKNGCIYEERSQTRCALYRAHSLQNTRRTQFILRSWDVIMR